MPAPSRQPVFTDIPILVSTTLDPIINSSSTDIGSLGVTALFTATDTNGTLIERITVSATGDTSHTTVTAKLIYLAVYDTNTGQWNVYKTAAMPAATIDPATPNPEIEWVFTGGLLLPESFEIAVLASTNQTSTGQQGDKLAVTIEGSSYTAV